MRMLRGGSMFKVEDKVERRPPARTPAPAVVRISLWDNYISFAGYFLVGVGALSLLTFFLLEFVNPSHNPYVEIIGYLVLPGVFTMGLALVPLGMVVKYVREHRAKRTTTLHLPRIDLNRRSTRARILAFVLFSFFIVVPLLAISGYQSYEYTESTEFCAKVCHSVMEPEAVAHSYSPHARVSCAECHIGPGADWFVKSKLSGVRQVFAVMAETYSRPIPPAITELRPARETCEQCHWPAKFFGSQYKEVVHYSPDEENTRRVVRILLKTGGADRTIGRVEGIHMHMVLYGQIEYVATDEGLQNIPWVRYVTEDGEEYIYRSDGKSADDPRPEGVVRTVDCMDCHNRGAHHFRSPQQAVDLLLDVERIDASLPYIKREAVDALIAEYPDKPTALQRIRERLLSFYRINYPEVWQARQNSILESAETVVSIYENNVFPEMKVFWNTYPENIGHMYSPGCFRCHDGKHVNRQGQAISPDCRICHDFLVPAGQDNGAMVIGQFEHSMKMVKHQNLLCSQCHTGGRLPLCRECHESGDWLDRRMPPQ
jgi:nitrate/TMAO reductase-like tetraheme cytochrome c subunit